MVYNAITCPVDHSQFIYKELKREYPNFLFNFADAVTDTDILVITVQSNSAVSGYLQQIIEKAWKKNTPVLLAYIRQSDNLLQLYHLKRLDENRRVIFGNRLPDGLRSIVVSNGKDAMVYKKDIGFNPVLPTNTLQDAIENLAKRIRVLESTQRVCDQPVAAKTSAQKFFKHNKQFLLLI